MKTALALLLTLLQVSQGVEALCDGRKDGAQCYGALGGSVDIRLMDSASDTIIYQWRKDDTTVLYFRKNKPEYGVISGRSSFTTSNGTLWINELTRDDGGNYTLGTFVGGKQQKPRTLQLTIQAPVSSVRLVSECQSQGEMRVSCSSEGGESPHYSWTLDGNTLNDTQLLFGNTDSQIIVLKQKVLGRLVCSVKNDISSKAEEEQISFCVPFLVVLGLRAAGVTLILTGIALYFVWKKKRIQKAEDSVVPENMDNENVSVMVVEMRELPSEL